MMYVIAEPCIDVKDKACIEECAVEWICDGERMLSIHPDECAGWGAREPVRAVEAIFCKDDVPGPLPYDTEYVASYVVER